jgi:hypothetical protein
MEVGEVVGLEWHFWVGLGDLAEPLEGSWAGEAEWEEHQEEKQRSGQHQGQKLEGGGDEGVAACKMMALGTFNCHIRHFYQYQRSFPAF